MAGEDLGMNEEMGGLGVGTSLDRVCDSVSGRVDVVPGAKAARVASVEHVTRLGWMAR